MWVWSLWQEDPLEEDMAIHSSILAWRIPWTEETGGLQSIGWQKVRYNWSNLARMDAGIHRVIRHQALRHSEMTSGMTVKEKKVQTQAFFDTPCLWESSPHLPTGRCLFFSPPLSWYSLFPSLRSKRYGRTCLWSEPIFKKLFWLPWASSVFLCSLSLGLVQKPTDKASLSQPLKWCQGHLDPLQLIGSWSQGQCWAPGLPPA